MLDEMQGTSAYLIHLALFSPYVRRTTRRSHRDVLLQNSLCIFVMSAALVSCDGSNTPGSGTLNEVNNADEGPLFPRYGIQHAPTKRWALMRVAGDSWPTPQGVGPTFVTLADVTFGVALLGSAVGIFSGRWALAACGRWALAAFCARVIDTMITADRWRHRMTVGNDEGDGVVECQSQVYPGANRPNAGTIRNFRALTPTSHTGKIDTERSYAEIAKVLDGEFRIPRR